MTDLVPVAARLGKLLRLLSSDHEGEVLAAARAINRTLEGEKLDIHALAEEVETSSEKKFSEKDALEIYRRGVQEGRNEAAAAIKLVEEPSWYEIACECADHPEKLYESERQFVRDMRCRTVNGGEPTEKQAKWLRSLYARVRR